VFEARTGDAVGALYMNAVDIPQRFRRKTLIRRALDAIGQHAEIAGLGKTAILCNPNSQRRPLSQNF